MVNSLEQGLSHCVFKQSLEEWFWLGSFKSMITPPNNPTHRKINKLASNQGSACLFFSRENSIQMLLFTFPTLLEMALRIIFVLSDDFKQKTNDDNVESIYIYIYVIFYI